MTEQPSSVNRRVGIASAFHGRRLRLGLCLLGLLIFGWWGAGVVFLYVADRASEQGRVTKAEGWLRICQILRPWDLDVRVLMAQCARRRKDFDKWSRIMGPVPDKKSAPGKIGVEQELMRVQFGFLEPDTQAQLNRLLAAGAEANDAAEAFACGFLARHDLQQAELVLGAWDPRGKRATDARYYLAMLARSRGDLNDAKALLESIIEGSPRHEMAHTALGEILLGARRPTEALRHYLTILRDVPQAAGARIGVARCLRALGRWNAARDVVRAIADSDSTGVAHELGEIALESGDYQSALSMLSNLDSPTESHEHRLALATTMALTGRYVAAEELLKSDARHEKLRKQLRDLQIQFSLAPDDSQTQERLQNVKQEILRDAKLNR